MTRQPAALIIVPAWYKVMWWLNRASPSLGCLLARRMFEVSKRMLLPGGGSSSTYAPGRGAPGWPRRRRTTCSPAAASRSRP